MDARLAVLRAVADALFPPLPACAAEARALGDELSARLYEYDGGERQELLLKVVERMEVRLTPENRRALYLLLRLLHTRLGSLLLLGRAALGSWGMPAAFEDLSREQRQAVLLQWAGARDANMRKAFKGLKALIGSTLFTSLTPEGTSHLLAAIRYPIADPSRPPAPATAAQAAEATVAGSLVDLSTCDGSPGSAARAAAALAAKGLRVEWPDGVKQPAIRAEHPHLVVHADVVVVGSGAGGGVAAARLAAAGLRVLVLEKAGFVPAAQMTLQEGQAFDAMYEGGGLLTSEDGTVSVLAGSTLGGGTRVNWCASFRTPDHVRREWAEELGLEQFASGAYDDALDAVCSRLSVHTGCTHNTLCTSLKIGLEVVGAACGEVPRNCVNPDCGGRCCFGCARGGKQDSLNTWLADACSAGARVITGVWAERVLMAPQKQEPAGSSSAADASTSSGAPRQPRSRRAVGVLVHAGGGPAPLRIVIKAPVVVSSCGSIHSPALLLRSKICGSGNVGSNLRIHPCTCVVGVFPPNASIDACIDARNAAAVSGAGVAPGSSSSAVGAQPGQQHGSIRCWEGAMMSIFSTQVGHWQDSGYGALLYTPAVHPGLFAAACPWLGGQQYKDFMLQYNNAAIVLVLVRDQGSGRVVLDGRGQPRIHYSLAPQDAQSMLQGMDLGLRCMAAAGAELLATMHNAPEAIFSISDAIQAASTDGPAAPPATVKQAAIEDLAASAAEGGAAARASAAAGPAGSSAAAGAADSPEFQEYLAGVQRTGIVPLQTQLFCAHQMGTCRLGVDPKASVLDPGGECWEVANLYCLDGSTFPTPTGVNPMITIESISYMLAGRLAEREVARLKGRGKWNGRRAGGGSGVQLQYESGAKL